MKTIVLPFVSHTIESAMKAIVLILAAMSKFLSFLCFLEHKKPKPEIKSDPDSAKEDSVDEDDHKLVIKEEQDSHNEPEGGNLSQASSCDYNLSQFKDEPDFEADEETEDGIKQEESDSDEDMPLVSTLLTFCEQISLLFAEVT